MSLSALPVQDLVHFINSTIISHVTIYPDTLFFNRIPRLWNSLPPINPTSSMSSVRKREECPLLPLVTGKEKSQSCEAVRIGISIKGGQSRRIMAWTTPLIRGPLACTHTQVCPSEYNLRPEEVNFPDTSTNSLVQPEMLIGMDQYWSFATGEIIHHPKGPTAMNTLFGWVLSGPMTAVDVTLPSTSLVTHVLRGSSECKGDNRKLERQLHAFWELESLGIADTECTLLEQFQNVIEFQDGQYRVSLPWKDPTSIISDNYQLSLKRLHNLLRIRLRQTPSILEQYNQIMQEQQKLGIVEAVQPDLEADGRIHYLPHHAVIRNDKTTTKVRIVYDASARSSGLSLNDSLHVGPKFHQIILDILLRFRLHAVALVGDIEKAFLRIVMEETDRDVLRFLWVKQIDQVPPEIQVWRFTRVVFGVASSPFLLNATIQHHLNQYAVTHPEIVEQLSQAIYVDDVVSGAGDEESAYQLFAQSKQIFKESGFNLRKYITNSRSLQHRINVVEGVSQLDQQLEDETYTRLMLGTSQRPAEREQKVLGVRWDIDQDELVFDPGDIADLANKVAPIKRQVVSLVGRFYMTHLESSRLLLFLLKCSFRNSVGKVLVGISQLMGIHLCNGISL